MKKSFPLNLLVTFLMVCALIAGCLPQGSEIALADSLATPVPKFALLVGISNYNNRQGLAPLKGPLNDVEDVRASLIKNFEFASQNITVLTNEAATREGIVRAIRTALIQNAVNHPDGNFLFYYSGHGSQTPDVNGDEKQLDPTDKFDETLVTFDSTRNPRDTKHFDIVDDELDQLFGQVRAVLLGRGSLTSILDCCYSGTATRGPVLPSGARVREVPPDLRSYPQSEFNIGEVNRKAAQAVNYAAFAACMPTEKAEECDFNVPINGRIQSRAHGVLTYYLLQAMNEATRTTTNNQVWGQLSRAISGPYQQNPQLEGQGDQPFLGGSKNQTSPSIPYTFVGRTLTLDRGIESGAVKGGFVALASVSQQLQITQAEFGQSKVSVPAGLKIPPRGRLRLLTPFFGSDPIVVGLASPLTSANPVVQKLGSYYRGANANYVRFARTQEKAVATLILGSRADAFGFLNNPSTDSSASEKGYYISLGQGKAPLFDMFVPARSDGTVSETDLQSLRDCLENYAVQCKVSVLCNTSKESEALGQSVKVTTYCVPQSQSKNPLYKGTAFSSVQRASVRVGDGVTFHIENQKYRPLYVAVLWLSQDGSVTLLRTSDDRGYASLSPKGSEGDTVSYPLYQAQPPVGQENIKFFVSLKPIDVYYLERDPVTRAGSRPNVSPSPFDVIAGLALGTRGAVKSSDPLAFDTWTTENVGLSITP